MTKQDPSNEYDNALSDLKKSIALNKNRLTKRKQELKKLESVGNTPEVVKLHEAKQKEIEELIAQISDQEDMKAVLKAEATSDDEAQTQAALGQVRQELLDKAPSMAYIIKDMEFVFISDRSTVREEQNVMMTRYTAPQFVEYIANNLKINITSLPAHRVKQLFMNSNRAFEEMRYTVSPVRWKPSEFYLPSKRKGARVKSPGFLCLHFFIKPKM